MYSKAHITLFCVVFFFACSYTPATAQHSFPNIGTIDLKGWDFNKVRAYTLKGTWIKTENPPAFSPGISQDQEDKENLVTLPALMEKIISPEEKDVWLTTTLKVSSQAELGLSFIPPYTPCELYVNHSKVSTWDEKDLSKQYLPLPRAEEYLISLHLRTSKARYNEMISPPAIGKFTVLKTTGWRENFRGTLFLGILLLMLLYHFIMWIGRRKDKASLYFAFICLVVFVYQLTIKRDLRNLFPGLYSLFFELEYKLAYLSLALGWMLLILFLNSLFPRESHKKITLFFIVTSLIFSLLALVTTKNTFTAFRIPYLVILGLGGCYSIFITFLAKKHKRSGSSFISVGILIFILTLINDIIKGVFELSQLVYLNQIGFMFLLFMQATTISIRFLHAFHVAEYLSSNLKEEVNNQTAILKEKKKELELLNVKLLDVDKQKTIFFQNITHELRTPLTLIIGPLESLRAGKEIPEELKPQLTIIWRNALQLLNLINQLLDISRIDANEASLIPEAVDLVKLLQYIKGTFSSLAQKKEITFSFDVDGEVSDVYIDKNKMERIIINLLSNAFKFTPPGGRIELHLKFFPSRENQGPKQINERAFILKVKDTGIGIQEDHLPFIFDRFRQEDSSTIRTYGGAGIGLSLVKEYVQLHEGDITVSSKKGEGTTFTLTFPLRNDGSLILKDDSEPEDYPLLPPSALINLGIDKELKKKILLVENNQNIREHIIESLDDQYRIYEKENGEEALRSLATLQPDLIITDLMMPVMDGYSLIEKVRNDETISHIPILLTTAQQVKSSYPAKEEPTDFLPKPFSRELLISKIKRLLEISRKTNSPGDGENEEKQLTNEQSSTTYLRPRNFKHNKNRNTIFLVENNRDLVYFIRSNLEEKYNFYYALNGKIALETLQEIPAPDLIISDIMMDEMDGITFYHELNKNHRYRTVPVIFLTAKSSLAEKLEGLSIGAIDYIYKPFSMQELKFKIDALIEKQMLRELLHEKDKFAMMGKLFAGLFHEIMNPLGATYAVLDNMENYINSAGEYEKSKFQSYIERTNRNLSRINNLILNFRKLHHSRNITNEIINLEEIIKSIKEVFQHRMKQINFKSELDRSISIRTNPEVLTHILMNLVSNAIDAINGPGDILVKTGQTEHHTEIIVSDTGEGIPKEYLSQIFKPFFTTKIKGQGLGLYIVKDLLIKINWEIELESGENKGTQIILRGKK